MTRGTRLLAQDLLEADFATIGNMYGQPMAGGTIEQPCRIFILKNNTDGTIFWSFDGVDDAFFTSAGEQLKINAASAKIDEGGLFLSGNTRVFVRFDEEPTEGACYFMILYGKGD